MTRRNFIPTSLFDIASVCGHCDVVVACLEDGLVDEGCEYDTVGMDPKETCFVSPDDVVVDRVICSRCVVCSVVVDTGRDNVVPVVPVEDIEVVSGRGLVKVVVVLDISSAPPYGVVDREITCPPVGVVSSFGLKHPITSRLTDTVGYFPLLENYYSIAIFH